VMRWLRDRLQRELRPLVEAELSKVRIIYADPLVVAEKNRAWIDEQLRAAANVVGHDVIVGRDVILFGGKFPTGRGLELHDYVRIYDFCRLVIDQISPDSGIVLEERVAMNFGCYIDGSGGIRIGKRTILGPNVVIVSSGHRVDPEVPIQHSGKNFASVEIAEDVWIGANAVIRMGVTVGAGAVIGAGSIVTKDVAPHAVVAGNPARALHVGAAASTP
jgi:acetyltransferase-like isoleucine patch superfamily enzyme